MYSLYSLPSEILWHVVSYLNLEDLSIARTTSEKLQQFCDHPSHWRHLRLAPPRNQQLWQLEDLKRLLEPHVQHIRSIEIWGIRDNILRYLLTRCEQLTELTVYGWTTLSNHAFRLPDNNKKSLRRLKLIGQNNYAALDARVLSQILNQCPDLEDLMLGCQVHIHAKTLLKELKRRRRCGQSLRSITLATRRTWSRRYVAELLELCPALERVCLLPTAAAAAAAEQVLKPQVAAALMMMDPRMESEEDDEEEDDDTDVLTDMVVFRSTSS